MKPRVGETKHYKTEKVSLDVAVGYVDSWHDIIDLKEDDEAFYFELDGLDIFLAKDSMGAVLITSKKSGKKRIKFFEEDGDMTMLVWDHSERVYIDSETAKIQIISG